MIICRQSHPRTTRTAGGGSDRTASWPRSAQRARATYAPRAFVVRAARARRARPRCRASGGPGKGKTCAALVAVADDERERNRRTMTRPSCFTAAERGADQCGDDALVPDRAARLAPCPADRPEHPDLADAIED